jgi:hypothetical protein
MTSKDANEQHMKQKRARSQLSCAPCRQGKLRCNRGAPSCDQCVKRHKESLCSYLPPATKPKNTRNVKGRIQHLEQLVVDLMNSRSMDDDNTSTRQSVAETSTLDTFRTQDLELEITPPYSEDSNSPADQYEASQLASFGHLRIGKDGTSYVGSSHWATILDSISELKRELEVPEDEVPDEEYDAWQTDETLHDRDAGPPGFLRSPRTVTKGMLISLLPSKPEVDVLVSLWFQAPHPFKILIHAPQFQEEYRQYWKAPQKAPVMWIGLLYAMISMAAIVKIRSSKNTAAPDVQAAFKQADLYQELAASAAVLGNYWKPREYTIECLLLHCGNSRSNDLVDFWLSSGVISKLALRMGYHRDPSHYNNISVLAGEMRRRVWLFLSMSDVLVSFQLGLPTTLRAVQSDTMPPRNLFDHEISTHSKTLPQS